MEDGLIYEHPQKNCLMKLFANENFPIASVRILENAGYDIKYSGLDHAGVKDSEVMDIAINEQRTILTFDRDYGELIFKKRKDLFESMDMKFEDAYPYQ